MKTKFEIITTDDGSVTLKNNIFDETYHSVFGAVSETKHVFINNGFNSVDRNPVKILEIGFGTGQNAFLTMQEAEKQKKQVFYTGIEKFPVNRQIIEKLNYQYNNDLFLKMHEIKENEFVKISDFFSLKKIFNDIKFVNLPENYFNLVYFDAFSYDVQPEMWSAEIFEKISKAMENQGVLVTYSAKGIIKQRLRDAGFEVKRLPGFKKHHMLTAKKI